MGGIENLAVPDLVDRKGSLWLKSNHMYYGKRTLNSDWHAAREAEPKDYDVAMASDQERNQHLATYKRIGNDPPTIPKSTMHAGLEDALTSRRDYEAKKKNPGGMVDFGRGYGTAIRNYLPEEILSSYLDIPAEGPFKPDHYRY